MTAAPPQRGLVRRPPLGKTGQGESVKQSFPRHYILYNGRNVTLLLDARPEFAIIRVAFVADIERGDVALPGGDRQRRACSRVGLIVEPDAGVNE